MLPQRIKVFEALCFLYAKRLYYIHIRQVAQWAHVPVSTASTELKILEGFGLVMRKGVRGGWKPLLVYERTYHHLLDNYRRTQNYVSVQVIADLLKLDWKTVRKSLRRLGTAGLVVEARGGVGRKGRGYRGGWKPKRRTDINPASGQVLEVLSQLYVEDFSFVRTVEIAQKLDVSAKHVRNVLRDYEGVGRVERLGQRGGWRPVEKVLSYE